MDLHVLHPIDEPRAGDRVGEVVLLDERGDRQGDRGAESAVFDVDRNGDLRVVLRCERQEGRVVAPAGVLGRTGLTAVTTAILFGLALFLSPIFLAIPSFATAPALIVVGFYMLTNVVNIDFSDLSEAIPCYICIGAMPFFYSISEGIAMGVISYVAIQILSGKAKEKKISVILSLIHI